MQETAPTDQTPTTDLKDLTDPENGLFGPYTKELLGAPEPAPELFLQYDMPNTSVSPERLIKVHESLGASGNPALRNLSVLPVPTLVDRATIEDQEREAFNERLKELQSKPMMQFDPSRADRDVALLELVNHRFAHNHGFTQELEIVGVACRTVPDYAWSWQSAVAMCAFDEGVDSARANRAAARFMHMLFKCDISKIPHFADSQRPIAVNPNEQELGVLVAVSREAFYNSYNQYWNAIRAATGVSPVLAPFPEVDRNQIEYPFAYAFAPPSADGQPIRVVYIAAGQAVQASLDNAAREGMSTEPAMPVGTEVVEETRELEPLDAPDVA